MKQPFISENAELLADWDYAKNSLLPENVSASSDKKAWWKCPSGHSYFQAVKNHTRGARCPYCYGKLVLPGFNDLCTENPPFLREWDADKNFPSSPKDYRLHSNKSVWWKCDKGHSWRASITNRERGNGCPYCSGRRVLPGFNDLATTSPTLASQWDYENNSELSPEMVTAGSNRKVWWRCEHGHGWKAVISARGTRGCPYCAGKRAIPGQNDLLTINPYLAAEWDYEKNDDLSPEIVLPYSSKKVWWKCQEGHSWIAAISNRSNGNGCPYCAGIFPIVGKTDFESQHPELLFLWDYENNSPVSPSQFTCGSAKKVWWRCDNAHHWKSSVSAIIKGSRCPYCAGRKVWLGFNDLKTMLPDVADEWDYEKNGGLIPEQFTKCSRKKVWWRCKYGHSWQTEIQYRRAGTGCPYCSGNLAIRGENDLMTLRPDLAEQWDSTRNGNLTPNDISIGSNRHIWWQCPHGHHWKTIVYDRVNGSGCPYCSGKTPLKTHFIT